MYKKYYSPFEEEPIIKEAGTGRTVNYTPKAEPEILLPQKALPPQQEQHKDNTYKAYDEYDEKDRTSGMQEDYFHNEKNEKKSFFGSMDTEDIILLGILVLLLLEDKENRDIPLVLAVAFLLLVEYI